jgi:hypothetical protein
MLCVNVSKQLTLYFMLTIVAKNVAVSIPLNLAIFSTLIVVYSFRYDRTC